MGMALERWEVVPQNPFLAYAIVRWQWDEHIKELDHEFKLFLALGLLTVASVIVPGAAGLVLAGIDIGVGVAQGIGGVQDAEALLDLAKLDEKNSVRGVTVEQARHALHTAWIGLGLTVLLSAAGLAGLFGRLLMKGRGASQIPAEFTRLSALVEVNPVAAEKMIAQVKDLAKVESLLEITGDSALLEKMLDKTARVGELEFVLMHGDPRKLMELIDVAGDAGKLGRVLEHAPDLVTAERLLRMTDDADGLAVLLKTADNAAIADELLGWTTPSLANRMLSMAGDQSGLLKLRRTNVSPQVALDCLPQVENADELAKLVPRMDSGADQVGRLLKGRTGKELEALLDRNLRPRDIEMGLGTPRVGPQPTFPTNQVPLTPEMREIPQTLWPGYAPTVPDDGGARTWPAEIGVRHRPIAEGGERHLERARRTLGARRRQVPGRRGQPLGVLHPCQVPGCPPERRRGRPRRGLPQQKFGPSGGRATRGIPRHSQRWMLSWSHAKKP